ncbi:MAG: hypothetical protein FJ014_19550 [Chloroflexi bacterium]|nr:hypothetical protein [Chloroflexota bacterium]
MDEQHEESMRLSKQVVDLADFLEAKLTHLREVYIEDTAPPNRTPMTTLQTRLAEGMARP